ncbi:undecaprenyl diphosphate synthase [Paenibacillus anaericanus]|uniref:Isoprenyl transferase n=1 Tax=Paenibacillus anaericanus TaxID=170367 RepID=A0A3S1BQ13_9BACL|nr:isoprenyl transferase [Paenibacillus anaericanus]MDQ0090590.1 undecaprenyl diphosphate synthase [Paenibacillus anaericanus]RUT46869.1 isoprenyl transferase [Paenibacillus anaericanus]
MIKLFQSWWKKGKSPQIAELSPDNVPEHVAIIMDGNGRWARRLGLPRIVGHRNGMKAVKRATIAADDLGVRILTLYAFSTENWKRPKDEVDFLMSLPQEFLALELEELIQKGVQVRMMGHTEDLPEHTIKAMEEAIFRTKDNTGLILNFALNYGGRREITESLKGIARKIEAGEVSSVDITEDMVQSALLSAELPDPDLLIRTGGELRLSNFMLWQTAYSELWFTDLFWPEFGREHLIEAVAEYQRRTRRYGGLS